jgi:hypothetical protein
MARITVSSHIKLYETIEELQKDLYFKDPENQLMLNKLLKWTSRERGAWTNCEIIDPFRFIVLTGLVYARLEIMKLAKKIEALEAKPQESNIEPSAPKPFEERTPESDLDSSTQEDFSPPSFRQTGLDENIFQN